jgi:hypothetical protein
LLCEEEFQVDWRAVFQSQKPTNWWSSQMSSNAS